MEKYSYFDTMANHSDGKTYVKFQLPKKCVHCHEIMTPEVIHLANSDNEYAALLLRCSSCKEFFAVTYNIKYDSNLGDYVGFIIPYSYSVHVDYDLADEIELFSPESKEIYIQSKTAEAYNLPHVAGIGYRKSIEFLIKDFLINVKNLKQDKISTMPLSQAIDKIDNGNIKSLAKATAWIGNDEAHYKRKHPDKDVKDLKKFLKALSHFLSFEYLTEQSLSMTNDNSSRKSN